MTIRPHQKDRRDVNPALGARKLKLGTFQTNLDSGCAMSDLDGRLELTVARVKMGRVIDR